MIVAVHSCILFFVILLNTSGIFCLILTNKSRVCNQMMILVSLSSCNITLSILWTGDMLFAHYKAKETIFYHRWWPFIAGIYFVWYMMILLLTADRFLGCNFPLKHRLFIRKTFILGAIGVCWSIGLALAIIGSVFGSGLLRPTIRKYGWPTLDILFLLFFAVTYGSILCVLARRRSSLQTTRSSDQSQFISTVTVLLVCFVALEAVPSLVNAFVKPLPDAFESILLIIYKVNLICDPLIYIFLQRKVRRFAIAKLRSFFTLMTFSKKRTQVYVLKDRIQSNNSGYSLD